MLKLPPGAKRIYINTGNILNLNEIKKKAGQDPANELVETVRLLAEKVSYQDSGNGEFLLRGPTQEDTNEEGDLFTSVKVFINGDDPIHSLKQSVNKVLSELELSKNDSLILAYNGNLTQDNLSDLVEMWSLLEAYSQDKLLRLGLCDIDTQLFIKFYDMVKVKPSIFQINLASCCVVPPALQEFAKEKDMQLLTHNDPLGLLEEDCLNEGETKVRLQWAVRYQIHVKCRGVLVTKGYLLSLDIAR